MRIFSAGSAEQKGLWERCVAGSADATIFHRWGWKEVTEKAFGWPAYYLMAEDGGRIRGILPIVWQKSLVFGSFMTSLPFLNGGGIVADSADAQQALLDGAIRLARDSRVKYLELRHRKNLHLGLPSKTSKVSPLKRVEPDCEKMWDALTTKLRTKIRKATKSGMEGTVGGAEFLDSFYEIFSENMRNLGTPVYSRRFFSEILRVFPNDTFICLVRMGRAPVAASFLLGFRDTVEAAWSGSRYAYLNLKPNMLLYWENIQFAGKKGYRYFDFGRSTVGSGTHVFKQQWGTEDLPLCWDVWLPDGGALPELNPENPRYRAAIWTWQHLPVSITRLIGPSIVRCLP